jgi:hypothetical protein
MILCPLIFYSICLIATAGMTILLWERHRLRLNRAKRWRMAFDSFDLKSIHPFKAILNVLEKGRREKTDIEIYEAVSFLRNIAFIGKGGAFSTDAVLEQLILHKGSLSPIYGQMLRLLRQNQKEEAIEYFSKSAATEIGKDFGRLLMQWDEIEPSQLLETLLSHQKSIREARMTAQKRRDETVSDLIYLPVVVNLMLIFINFIYIGYFIDQREMLTILV